MLYYRQNHNGNIFKQLICSLNVLVKMCTFSFFGLCVGAFKNRGKFSNGIDLSCDDVFNVKCIEKAHN